MSGRAAHISDLARPTSKERRWAPVRQEFGIEAFGITAWTATGADQELISEHDESGPGQADQQELFFVANGHAVFTVDGDEIDAPTGTFVFVRDAKAKRKATATELGTTILAVGAPAGEPYKVVNWERSVDALRHWETKDWPAAVAELSKLYEEDQGDPGLLYNLACAESLAGDTDAALGHLERAVQIDAKFRTLAAEDDDFDPIRADPRFSSAIAGQPDAGGSST